MEKPMVGIVVVTFNRLELLKKNIEAIKNQTYDNYQVYIINNASTDGTYEYLKTIDLGEKFSIIHMKENTGGAGGFYRGIKTAFENNCDFIWGMDDDAIPDSDALEKILNYVRECNDKVCYVSNVIHDEKFPDKNGLIEKNTFLFLGFFIPRHLVETIGLPRKELFIYFDDLEYSMRAKKAGYRIYTVIESVIRHPAMMNNSKKFVFLGKKFDVQDMPEWKWYYYMRNAVLAFPKSENKNFRRSTKRLLLGVLLAYPQKFGSALQGYVHGLMGKSGKR